MVHQFRFIFEWDEEKEEINKRKHGYSFTKACEVFEDYNAIHLEDEFHSDEEERYYAIGKLRDGSAVLTVRYTRRGPRIRIFGAANWRKWRQFYEEENS